MQGADRGWPSNFDGGGKGDVPDVEVQPHPDRVGGHEVVDVAVLVHRYLRVAGARRQRAHDDGGAPLLATQKLRDGINAVDREPDDGAAAGHSADLPRAGVGQFAEALAALHLRVRHQPGDGGAHRVGAEEQRLVQAAHMQQAVGKHMAAFGIGAELDLVYGDEIGAHALRHRLDGAHPIGGAGRNDPLLAGDERDDRGAAHGDDAVVDLSRQQPQRQADHPGAMREHALDRVMRLAGICRPQHGRDACQG